MTDTFTTWRTLPYVKNVSELIVGHLRPYNFFIAHKFTKSLRGTPVNLKVPHPMLWLPQCIRGPNRSTELYTCERTQRRGHTTGWKFSTRPTLSEDRPRIRLGQSVRHLSYVFSITWAIVWPFGIIVDRCFISANSLSDIWSGQANWNFILEINFVQFLSCYCKIGVWGKGASSSQKTHCYLHCQGTFYETIRVFPLLFKECFTLALQKSGSDVFLYILLKLNCSSPFISL